MILTWIVEIIRDTYLSLSGVATVAILADPGCREGWERNFTPLLRHVWERHRPGLFITAGDLSLHSWPEEYERIISVMGPYPSRIAAVAGDHDRPLRRFIRYFGPTRKVIDVEGWRFIGLNTANRRFTAAEAAFLEEQVREKSVIFTHLPPAAEGWTFHSLWHRSSNRFLSCLNRHRDEIHACFFGHIHGHSVRTYRGIPLVATGGIAESRVVHDNCYQGQGLLEMMIFDTATGTMTLCALDGIQ